MGRDNAPVPQGTCSEPQGQLQPIWGPGSSDLAVGRMPWSLVWKLYLHRIYLALLNGFGELVDVTEKCFS